MSFVEQWVVSFHDRHTGAIRSVGPFATAADAQRCATSLEGEWDDGPDIEVTQLERSDSLADIAAQ
jgi:hypothetical protein